MYTYIFESLLTLRKSYYLTYKTIISNNKKLLRKYSNLENKDMLSNSNITKHESL